MTTFKQFRSQIEEAFYTDQASWEEDMKEHGASTFDSSEHRIIAKKADGDILGAWSVSDKHGLTGLGVNVQSESIDGSAEEKVVKKQQSINKIIAAYRIGKIEKSAANARLREKGHQGITETTQSPRKKKSIKEFRGSRTATGQKPNPIDLEPKLKLNKTVMAMSHKGY